MKRNIMASLRRMALFLVADVRANLSRVLFMAGAIAAIFFLGHFFRNPSETAVALQSGQLTLLFFVILPIYSSYAFVDVHNPRANQLALTLPLSNAERWAVKLLQSTIVFAIATFATYAILTLFLNGFDRVFRVTANPFPVFLWPQAPHWQIFLGGILFSSPFFFGGIYFRRSQQAKTMLSLAGLGTAFALFAGYLFFRVFASEAGPSNLSALATAFSVKLVTEGSWDAFFTAMKVAAVIIAVFFWGLALLRLSETEVKGGLQK